MVHPSTTNLCLTSFEANQKNSISSKFLIIYPSTRLILFVELEQVKVTRIIEHEHDEEIEDMKISAPDHQKQIDEQQKLRKEQLVAENLLAELKAKHKKEKEDLIKV